MIEPPNFSVNKNTKMRGKEILFETKARRRVFLSISLSYDSPHLHSSLLGQTAVRGSNNFDWKNGVVNGKWRVASSLFQLRNWNVGQTNDGCSREHIVWPLEPRANFNIGAAQCGRGMAKGVCPGMPVVRRGQDCPLTHQFPGRAEHRYPFAHLLGWLLLAALSTSPKKLEASVPLGQGDSGAGSLPSPAKDDSGCSSKLSKG